MKQYYNNKDINKVANQVVKLMPKLDDFFSSEKNLSEYSREINIYNPPQEFIERQKILKRLMKEKINTIFNEDELKNIDIRIDNKKSLTAGSVDHHGVLSDPILASTHVVPSFYRILDRKTHGDIVTFATSNIPFNEPFNKGGIVLHDKKINLYPKKFRHKLVYGMEKYNYKIVELLKNKKQWHLFTEEEKVFLCKIDEHVKSIDFSSCQTIGDQITKINFYIWKKIFADDLQKDLVNLIIIEDTVIADALAELLENDNENYIYKILFDKKFRNIAMDKFRGVPGAWDENKNVGTHLFWAINSEGKRVRLNLDGEKLVGKGCEFELKPEIIIEKLKNRELIMCMIIKFIFLVAYMGVKTFLGASIEYTSRMIDKLKDILEEYFPEEYQLTEKIVLDNMNVANIFLYEKNCKVYKPYVFEMIFRGGINKKDLEVLNKIPYKNFLLPLVIFVYNYSIDKYGDIDQKETLPFNEADLDKLFTKEYLKLI